jgi:hypothetical protein
MSAIPIFSRERFYRERESGNCSGSYLSESSLPFFYMSDYSVLGLLVDDLPLAVQALEGGNIALDRSILDQEIVTIGSRDFLRAVQLLYDVGVRSDIIDVVYGIYQG